LLTSLAFGSLRAGRSAAGLPGSEAGSQRGGDACDALSGALASFASLAEGWTSESCGMSQFIDEATITVRSGAGGDGCTSFRREKFVPRGGPDGGDGGRGGDVVLVADRNLATLSDQRLRRDQRAASGAAGAGANRTGRSGRDLEIRLPVGTLVHDLAADPHAPPLADLIEDGQRQVVARGGRGGRGNARFATATRQAPDFAEPGRPGESRQLRLTLKLLADVGLVGFPNAGKSTLLAHISKARPRVADYPFTTLQPVLGVAEVGSRRFVVADIPGLIEGASDGAGLGDRFLRHIERTGVLVHLIDAGTALLEERDVLASYEAIRSELAAYGGDLLERREIVALNKVDLLPDRDVLAPVERNLRERGRSVLRISGATGEGVPALLAALVRELDAGGERDPSADVEHAAREAAT
jgi:GTP-binding protein